VKTHLRRIVATLTLTTATLAGTALTTSTARADTLPGVTIDDTLVPTVHTVVDEVVARPLDTYWG